MCPPSLDDLPTLAQIAVPTGDDLLPIYDLTGTGSSKVRKVSLNQINGVSANDVVLGAGDAAVVATRLVIFSGRTAATAATIPAASGVLRDIIIQNANTSSGAVTVTSPSTNIYTSSSASASATSVIAIATTARYLSDGTNWYRTH
jgi:hypothetical protein